MLQYLNHTSISSAVGELAKTASVFVDDMRMTVVVLTREKHQPLSVGRPLRNKVEGVAGLDASLVAPVGIRDEDLVVFVVTDAQAIGRRAVAIAKSRTFTRDISFVAAIESSGRAWSFR